ncbi:membrane integrity-associated transporter subunit PqiA [Erwinia psidii]|uniref:membrane integrity-associated transporter subunit PqiA n=1 Tax=Erwinia psidii TaxID=69224 RepID=UPI00226B7176|nr:membrane integrity-associated transporter subunit PqiA [Erwinia psidii]MCX8964733.1 membrane integrity-associated transporter subunit PqiA [Erwinia psidii]
MCSSQQADRWVLCPQCDLMVQLPELQLGSKANCPRCETMLLASWHEPQMRPTAYALAALLMLVLANLFPFATMRVAGLSSEITLMRIPQVMVSENYSSLATLFMLFVQALPALCMVAILLLVNPVGLPLSIKRVMAKMLFCIKNWGMAEIFLAGVLVSFVKLMAYGDIGIGTSFIPWCFFCLLQVRAFQCIDRRSLWARIAPVPALPVSPVPAVSGLHQGLRSCRCCTAVLVAGQVTCPRCTTNGYIRHRHSLQCTLALLVTSFLLYIPANLMPVMVTETLGNKITSTIMAGVILLWSEGSWPIALVIFIASIMVPSLKMLAIGWLCWDASGKGKMHQDSDKMHKIYDVVEFVGRWSMIDVFVIAILSALVRMGQLMSIYPAIGALLFAMVVILTMFAAMTFDPRLSWDRVSEKSPEEPSIEGK